MANLQMGIAMLDNFLGPVKVNSFLLVFRLQKSAEYFVKLRNNLTVSQQNLSTRGYQERYGKLLKQRSTASTRKTTSKVT